MYGPYCVKHKKELCDSLISAAAARGLSRPLTPINLTTHNCGSSPVSRLKLKLRSFRSCHYYLCLCFVCGEKSDAIVDLNIYNQSC